MYKLVINAMNTEDTAHVLIAQSSLILLLSLYRAGTFLMLCVCVWVCVCVCVCVCACVRACVCVCVLIIHTHTPHECSVEW